MRTSTLAVIALVDTVGLLALYPSFWLICGSVSTKFGTCGGFNLAQYKILFSNRSFYSDIGNTLVFAFSSSILATVLALVVSWIVTRTNTPMRRIFEVLAIAPNLMPPILLAISWTLLLNPNNGILNVALRYVFGPTFPGVDIVSLPGAIFVEGMVGFPFAFLIISAALKTMDPSFEEAARVSGIGISRTTIGISFSMILPAILGAWLLRLVQDMEAFEVPGIILIPSNVGVLTTFIQEHSQVIIPPNNGLAAAAGVVTFAITGSTVIFYILMTRRAERFVTISARGYRPSRMDLGKGRYLTALFAILLLFAVLILPVFVLFFVSLEQYVQFPSWYVIAHFTLHNYVSLLTASSAAIIRNTLAVTILGATAAMILATTISYLNFRTNVKGKRLLEILLFLPFSFPGIVLGVGLLWAYLLTPIAFTIWILLLGYITRFLPYGVRATNSTIVQIHRDQEDASRVTGAGFLRTFRKVVLPLLRPGFVAGWVLLASVFMREVGVSILLTRQQNQVIGPYLFYLYQDGQLNQLAAFALLVILISAILISIAQRFGEAPGAQAQ